MKTYTYTGESGIKNMKADLNEIIDACGEYTEFLEFLNEVKEQRDESKYQIYMESKLRDL